MINCNNCGLVPEKIDNLPVLLPEIDDYLNNAVPELTRKVMSLKNMTLTEKKAIMDKEIATLKLEMQATFIETRPRVYEYFKFRRKRASARAAAQEEFRTRHGRQRDLLNLDDLIELNILAGD